MVRVELTERQIDLIHLLASYAYWDINDLNEAFVSEVDPGKLELNGELVDIVGDTELDDLQNALPILIRWK